MRIEKDLFLQLREAAQATCGNVFLLSDGRIVDRRGYKALPFIEKLSAVMYYDYIKNVVVKI